MPVNILVTLLLRSGLLCEGLRHLLSGNGIDVAVAASHADIAAHSDQSARHVILIDESLVRGEPDLCKEIRSAHDDAKLVILADRFDFEAVVGAVQQGIDGYLVRDISPEPLIGALRLIALGEKVLPSEMAIRLGELRYPSKTPDLADVNLSDREVEVLRLLVQGSANKVIGRRLGICEATVKVHVKAALRKIRVANRTQAAIWAVQRGLAGTDLGTIV
jgi:two-component system nitrate/nitrite response regulator NarL